MGQADFGVFPEDVRANIELHRNVSVAWAGVLKQYEVIGSASPQWVRLTLEHHYFNWKVDASSGVFWLSPRGEGEFLVSWPVLEDWTEGEMSELFETGCLFVAYGTPDEVNDGGQIDLGNASYLRLLPRESYRTDVISYGRPGEPSEVIGSGL